MSIIVAGFPDSKHIAQKVAKGLKAKYANIFVEDFPDSEFHIVLKGNPENKTVVIVSSMSKDPNGKLIETILAGGIAKDYGAKKVILVATYFPYMRQDKHFIKHDSLSSRQIIKLLSNFDHIITIDPHLHRIKHMSDLTRKAESISAKELIVEYIQKRFKNDFTIIGPDEESAQWNKPVANKLGKEVFILKKTRLSSTHIKQKGHENETFNKNVIIIDDIVSTGKTIAGALALAKRQGAKKLFCIGIHGVLVNNADKLITKNAELITTNTIPNHYSKIDVSPIIVKALKKYS